jgi:hypothetical protein
MHKFLFLSFVLLLLIPTESIAQNRKSAQNHLNLLASDVMFGRGYLNEGDLKAAQYIQTEFRKMGLDSLHKGYFQHFNFGVNTIPSCRLLLDQKELIPGRDYFVAPESPGLELNAKIFIVRESELASGKGFRQIRKKMKSGLIPVFLPISKENSKAGKNLNKIKTKLKPKLLVYITETKVWSVGRTVSDIAELYILDSAFNRESKILEYAVKSEYIESYKTQNVLGIVRGTVYPDSFIVICGHYDHLGMMGDAIFNGANDNASGISMILDMASYFSKNPQNYSIMFIAFAAEEAGLVGSEYFVTHPREGVSIKQIKFVFNLDLMGSGEDGATIVNGAIFKKEFDLLVKINEENQYLSKIKARGKAANSDHYFFTELGVHSFFIYLMGGYTYYHVPLDNPDNLILGDPYDRAFMLIRDFVIAINELN